MDILKEPNQRVLKDYKNNYAYTGQSLRPLSFLLRATEDDPSHERIYNVLTSGAIRMKTGEFQHLAEEKSGSQRDFLVQNMFLVPRDFDEYGFVDDIRFFYTTFMQTTPVVCNYFIYPTTACNARCVYCYEEGMRYRTMSPETAEKAAAYIIRHSGGETVQLRWFGGEPTLGIPVIEQISERLNDAGISFFSYINTNGFLFDRPLIRLLKEKSHLNAAQIPMDGMGEAYKQAKRYVHVPEGTDPWETVQDHIEAALEEGIRLAIRLNIGMHNRGDILDVLEMMVGRFACFENFSVIPQVLNEGGTKTYTSEERNLLFDIQKEAFLYCRDHHVKIAKNRFSFPSLRLHSCFADDGSWVGISPEGDLYQCPENIDGTTPFSNVGEDGFSAEKAFQSPEKSNWSICRECAFYPSCVNLKNCCARQNRCDSCHRDFRQWKTETLLLGL